MATVAQRLARRLVAGANAVLCFELTDGGELVTDLAGASGTARLGDAELPVVLDAAAASATLTLTPTQTRALEPAPGEPFGQVAITVRVTTAAGLICFFGPAEVQIWASAL